MTDTTEIDSPTVGGMPRAEWDERMRIEYALGQLPDETTRPIPPAVP